MKVLDRHELIQKLNEIELWPEILSDLDFYLEHSLSLLDLELIKILLQHGANPSAKEDIDCFLHDLLHKYLANKTLKGDLILSVMEELLKAGANPNRIWSNNLRAYDYAKTWGVQAISDLLEKYGVDKELREPI